MRVVKPLDHIPYIKKEAINELTENLDGRLIHINTMNPGLLASMKVIGFLKSLVITSTCAHFSSLILTGQMSREEAIKKIAKPVYDKDMIAQILNILQKNWT